MDGKAWIDQTKDGNCSAKQSYIRSLYPNPRSLIRPRKDFENYQAPKGKYHAKFRRDDNTNLSNRGSPGCIRQLNNPRERDGLLRSMRVHAFIDDSMCHFLLKGLLLEGSKLKRQSRTIARPYVFPTPFMQKTSMISYVLLTRAYHILHPHVYVVDHEMKGQNINNPFVH